jgi:hypothetical protein
MWFSSPSRVLSVKTFHTQKNTRMATRLCEFPEKKTSKIQEKILAFSNQVYKGWKHPCFEALDRLRRILSLPQFAQ